MALGDYYLCDLCEKKTFYDAGLDYSDDDGDYPAGAGDMAVICKSCAETNVIVILPKSVPATAPQEDGE